MPHRVLLVSELLGEILGQIAESDQRSCLFVCKSWSNEVLDTRWRMLRRPEKLFRLLVPMKRKKDGQYYFSRTLQDADWSRFFYYSCRVKFLSLSSYGLSPAVYSAIRRYKPSSRLLLPNMTTFFCPCSLEIFDLFSHPNITFLWVTNSDHCLEKVDHIRSFFTNLPNNLPRLERLIIRIDQEGSFQQVGDDVAKVISSFPNLKTISIHPEWHTPPVAEAISTRPHLHMLDAYDDWEDPKRLPPQLPVFAHPLGPNHFPSLTKMSITIGFEQAVRCLGLGRCVLDQVTSFTMNSRYYETRETYSRMLKLLPRVFPNICELLLDANSDLVPEDMLESRVTYDDLQPLLSLQHLTDLTLHHSMPFQLCGMDLKQIVSSLTELGKLSLNYQPIKSSTTSLHLSALSELCFEGNSLYDIQLYVDMSASQLPGEDYHRDGRRLHPTLQYLFIGAADLLPDDILAVSKYLNHVLPLGFDRFQSNLEWDKQEVFWQLREATAALLSA